MCYNFGMCVKEIADFHCPMVLESFNLKELLTSFQKAERTTLPVVDRAGVLKGLISLHDLIKNFLPRYIELIPSLEFLGQTTVLEKRLLAQIMDPLTCQLFLVHDVMVKKVVAVKEDDSVFKAMVLMINNNYHHLPVVDEKKVCVAMIDQRRIILSLFQNFCASPKSP